MPISVGDSLFQKQIPVKQENVQSNSVKIQAEVQKQYKGRLDQGNTGHWSEQENLLYMAFLNAHKMKFRCRLKKKKIRLFQLMAEFLGSRSAVQCRTHHQKYQNKYGDVKTILRVYRQMLGPQNYKMCIKWKREQIKNGEKAQKIAEDFKSVENQNKINSHDISVQVNQEDIESLKSILNNNNCTQKSIQKFQAQKIWLVWPGNIFDNM